MAKVKKAGGKKERKRKENKDGPKRGKSAPKSAYVFFCQEERLKVMKEQPSLSITEASKVTSDRWEELTDADKQPYQEMAAKDKARYEAELAEQVQAQEVKEV